MKNLIFFNYFHNGDIHVSREFVKDILNKTNFSSYVYYHENSSKLLKDIDIIKYENIKYHNFNNDLLFYEDDENVYINTWFHFDYGYKYYQCTLESLYYNFTQIYKGLNIKLENIEYYIPQIDFTKFDISNIDKFFLDNKFEKYIFISNGMTLSGQSDNINLNPFIFEMSQIYKNYLFILTAKLFDYDIIKSDNIILSKDIIKSNGFDDLVENSYLSTKCDIIIGRTSGVSTFSIVKENVLSDKKQNILHMSHYKPFLNEEYYNKNKKLYCIDSGKDMIKYMEKIIGNYD